MDSEKVQDETKAEVKERKVRGERSMKRRVRFCCENVTVAYETFATRKKS